MEPRLPVRSPMKSARRIDAGAASIEELVGGADAGLLGGRLRVASGVPASAPSMRQPSSCSSAALRPSPPPKPVSAPVLPSTRWQGTMTISGLEPTAVPTARTAAGRPMRAATSV